MLPRAACGALPVRVRVEPPVRPHIRCFFRKLQSGYSGRSCHKSKKGKDSNTTLQHLSKMNMTGQYKEDAREHSNDHIRPECRSVRRLHREECHQYAQSTPDTIAGVPKEKDQRKAPLEVA
jgi:hypothetical protein